MSEPKRSFRVTDGASSLTTDWTRFGTHDRVYIAIEMDDGQYADIGLSPSVAARIGEQLTKIATYLEGTE